MSSFLFHLQGLAYIVLTWMVCEMGSRWLYSCCFVGCCFQDLLKTACSIVKTYCSTEMNTVWNNSHFIGDCLFCCLMAYQPSWII